MKMTLGNGWRKKLNSRINKFSFEVGILEDKAYKNPVVQGRFEEPSLKTYASGPVRQTSRQDSGRTIGDVFIENMKRLNINLLVDPFKRKNSDIMRFTRYFLMLVVRRPGISIKRVENLLQAIVRNPILKEEYGKNTAITADEKGFNRHLFDTGQMFKNIRAKVKKG